MDERAAERAWLQAELPGALQRGQLVRALPAARGVR
jgi:hypothetical protein